MTLFSRVTPRSMAGQMIAILALSFALLLAVLAILEALEQEDLVGWAQSDSTLGRLRRMKPAVELMHAERIGEFLVATSSCHEGYTLTDEPFGVRASSAETDGIATRIARQLAMAPDDVRLDRVRLTRTDFSYAQCDAADIDLPAEGIVIGLRLSSGKWLNAEVHAHEWHMRPGMAGWIMRTIGAFVLVGVISVFFVRRLTRPLDALTSAARRFGSGLHVSKVDEVGPPDLARLIRSFNSMQQQVADEIKRRADTLAAISHDVRSPLTALRIKAELIDDDETRGDLIRSIDAMERITASALEFLRGECRTEPMREIDLVALLESECSEFEEAGRVVKFVDAAAVRYRCRPAALACALRNLIDNAFKYGNSATVAMRIDHDVIAISVRDQGPGIPADQRTLALEPFERLSQARDSKQGGFGLGLSIVQAIVEGHDGEFVLTANEPTGLIAEIRLPRRRTDD